MQQQASQTHLQDKVLFQSGPAVSADEQEAQNIGVHYQMTNGHTAEHTHGTDGVWPHEHTINPALSFRLPTHSHVDGHATNSTTLHTVHITDEAVATFEMTPPHPPRVETEAYRQAHEYLIYNQDTPCIVCGVKQSELTDQSKNRYGSKAMETHHFPIERSLVDACDPEKVGQVYSQVTDEATLQGFVDSIHNLIVLCDVHHRSLEQGIHHLLTQDFAILPFLYDHYQIVATARDKNTVLANDQKIVDQGRQ